MRHPDTFPRFARAVERLTGKPSAERTIEMQRRVIARCEAIMKG